MDTISFIDQLYIVCDYFPLFAIKLYSLPRANITKISKRLNSKYKYDIGWTYFKWNMFLPCDPIDLHHVAW
jgi:hypothetical protein